MNSDTVIAIVALAIAIFVLWQIFQFKSKFHINEWDVQNGSEAKSAVLNDDTIRDIVDFVNALKRNRQAVFDIAERGRTTYYTIMLIHQHKVEASSDVSEAVFYYFQVISKAVSKNMEFAWFPGENRVLIIHKNVIVGECFAEYLHWYEEYAEKLVAK